MKTPKYALIAWASGEATVRAINGRNPRIYKLLPREDENRGNGAPVAILDNHGVCAAGVILPLLQHIDNETQASEGVFMESFDKLLSAALQTGISIGLAMKTKEGKKKLSA